MYKILVNFYTTKCTTNYMLTVNKTEITVFWECVYFPYLIQNSVLRDHNCHPSRIFKSVLYFKCIIILQ